MSLNVITIRNFENPGKELDKLLIPNEIYDLTISKNTEKIQEYFIDNPKLMMQFVRFNSTLKISNRLLNDRKCSCFYTMPWITKYANDNNIKKTILLFNQQIKLYIYMIKYWYPSTEMSYMRYLSSIALDIINELRRFNYNMSNNLTCSGLTCKKYIVNKFNNNREIVLYINEINKL